MARHFNGGEAMTTFPAEDAPPAPSIALWSLMSRPRIHQP